MKGSIWVLRGRVILWGIKADASNLRQANQPKFRLLARNIEQIADLCAFGKNTPPIQN
jgi:hypothetical protein